jgi:hypothetical protein
LTEGMRRAGFLATLAAGVALLGASLHGMTSVDTTLKLAAATATPPPAPQSEGEFVTERHHRHGPCGDERGHDHPRV